MRGTTGIEPAERETPSARQILLVLGALEIYLLSVYGFLGGWWPGSLASAAASAPGWLRTFFVVLSAVIVIGSLPGLSLMALLAFFRSRQRYELDTEQETGRTALRVLFAASWLTAAVPYLAVAQYLFGEPPFVIFGEAGEGPYSPNARREVASELFGSADLPAGSPRWRAYHRADFAFNGDYDKWFRLDDVTPRELTELLRKRKSHPPIEGCRDELLGRQRHNPSWWQIGQGIQLIAGEGVPGGSGECIWHDPAAHRVYAYAWLF